MSDLQGARYNAKTLEIKIRDNSIADVLAMNVDAAFEFFADDESLRRSLGVLREVWLGYIRLGQPATELSGGEAQRVKLATELQRAQRGGTLYVLDEPTTGLHPADVAKLMTQLDGLVRCSNTVIVIEHDMSVAAASDWIVDVGPGAGEDGGRIVAADPPNEVASSTVSRTASIWRKPCEGSEIRIPANEAGLASEPIRTCGHWSSRIELGGLDDEIDICSRLCGRSIAGFGRECRCQRMYQGRDRGRRRRSYGRTRQARCRCRLRDRPPRGQQARSEQCQCASAGQKVIAG
jgi:hypothetical protein